MPPRQSHCRNGHELSENNLYIYTGKDGRVRHICRTCQHARDVKRKKKRSRGYAYPTYE